MASRRQLQTALLDAAAILSSAANVARLAARSVDVDPAFHQRSQNRSNPATRTAAAPQPWPTRQIHADAIEPLAELHRINEHIPLKEAKVEKKPHPARGNSPSTSSSDHVEVPAVEHHSQDAGIVRRSDGAASTSRVDPRVDADDISVARAAIVSPTSPPQSENIEEYDATLRLGSSPLRATKVPSSRIARLLHYGSLGAGLAWGAAGSFLSRDGQGSAEGKQFMSDQNVRRLVDKLSTMRGAALKLGQFMSIQDSNLLPEQIEQVMMRLQNSAHYMPQWQMEQVMKQDLGEDWRASFDSFEDVPFASASIGQVHAATLSAASQHPLAGQRVAVKVQFPGVRQSIKSDLSNLRWLLTASALLPPGLFLQNTLRVMQRELDDECDYERERTMCERFGQLLNGKSEFAVPLTVPELCTPRVLTTEMMKGRPLTQANRFSQERRDTIARSILSLSLRELFTYRLMQTDPNWSNFLFNERTGKLELIDFGATREYSKEFMDDFYRMLRAAISGDRLECIRWSEKIGYLTGEEKDSMRTAHVDSMIALAEPFKDDAPDPYPFAGQTITERVRAQIPLMLRERLTPPPEPTYSLNRKLSGAFLLCSRLQANVSCRGLFNEVTAAYEAKQNSTATAFSHPTGKRSLHTYRERLGDLANRWPRHVVEAVKESLGEGPIDRTQGEYITLAAKPTAASTQEVSDGANLRTQASESAEAVINVRGVAVPVKPTAPGPESCCMSGCAVCVYDLYADELKDYRESLSAARTQIMALQPPLSDGDWDTSILGPRPSHESATDSRTAEERAQQEVEDLIGQLDPSMKAFLQLERSLKKKKMAEQVDA